MDILNVVLALVPVSSIVSAMVIWFSQRKIESRIAQSEERERSQEEMQLLLIKTVNASMTVAEALALAYKPTMDSPRIDALDDALEEMHKVQQEQKDFFQKQTVQRLNRGGDF